MGSDRLPGHRAHGAAAAAGNRQRQRREHHAPALERRQPGQALDDVDVVREQDLVGRPGRLRGVRVVVVLHQVAVVDVLDAPRLAADALHAAIDQPLGALRRHPRLLLDVGVDRRGLVQAVDEHDVALADVGGDLLEVLRPEGLEGVRRRVDHQRLAEEVREVDAVDARRVADGVDRGVDVRAEVVLHMQVEDGAVLRLPAAQRVLLDDGVALVAVGELAGQRDDGLARHRPGQIVESVASHDGLPSRPAGTAPSATDRNAGTRDTAAPALRPLVCAAPPAGPAVAVTSLRADRRRPIGQPRAVPRGRPRPAARGGRCRAPAPRRRRASGAAATRTRGSRRRATARRGRRRRTGRRCARRGRRTRGAGAPR